MNKEKEHKAINEDENLYKRLSRIIDDLNSTITELEEAIDNLKDQSSFLTQSVEDISEAMDTHREDKAVKQLMEIDSKLADFQFKRFAAIQYIREQYMDEMTQKEKAIFILAFIAVNGGRPKDIARALEAAMKREDGTLPSAVKEFMNLHNN